MGGSLRRITAKGDVLDIPILLIIQRYILRKRSDHHMLSLRADWVKGLDHSPSFYLEGQEVSY